MNITKKKKDAEAIQTLIARIVATHPAGRNLMLIGGFRYRLLNKSVRTSEDIDYHWAGELEEKQHELIDLFSRVLIPEVRLTFNYVGRVQARQGVDTESNVLRTVDVAFWQTDVPYSRIEIPVEITQIVCADSVTIRTIDGTIFATASDADMIESKIIAVVNRVVLRHRDLVDIFLFQDSILPDAPNRLQNKLHALNISANHVRKRMGDLQDHHEYHAKAIQETINTQLDTHAANQINDAGGGLMVLKVVLDLMIQNLSNHMEAK
ncbi:MAG: hypothetical protein EOM20_17005 [Spartobacteria bacterium]|nr:hypothetical protein [Spartobacteria bacterium]